MRVRMKIACSFTFLVDSFLSYLYKRLTRFTVSCKLGLPYGISYKRGLVYKFTQIRIEFTGKCAREGFLL
ncbi:hypothetical protein M2134_000914 [Parabacteroides sp. PM6-13]|nr:hypothetical protein [Parabacteroides sp. PM6-13]